MRYSSLRPLIAEANTRARAFSAVAEARQAIFEMTLSCFRQELADLDQAVAWQRVALTLADQRASSPIDALDASGLDRAQRRLALLGELPEVVGFASYEDLTALISNTINLGAPRYNSGDVRACGALYWMVVRLICETPTVRGIPGYARLQAQLKPIADAGAPGAPGALMTQAEIDAWAWELRHALDATAQNAIP